VDPKPAHTGIWLAPPPDGGSKSMRLPAGRGFPPIDEHIVTPETREEVVRGRRVVAQPANPEHGDRHFELDYVVRAHVQEGYVGSTDLLTRSSETSNFATDTCVRKQGKDPRTGTRYLEELAFEVVNEQSLRDMTERAEDLTARGVRRMIGVFVKTGEVREWSPASGAWEALDLDGAISDPVLARPIRVRELLDAAEADNAVARALVVKNNPVIAEIRTVSREEGLREGHLEAIEVACELLGVELTAARRAHLGALDAGGLLALLGRIRTERRWP